MSDLISRQAAIKAIHDEFDDCLVWDESGRLRFSGAKENAPFPSMIVIYRGPEGE